MHASSRDPLQPRVAAPAAGVRQPQGHARPRRRSSSASPTSCASATSRRTRDWSFAGDVAEAMWLMLQQDAGDDYVVCSGVSRTVRELVATRLRRTSTSTPSDHVVVDPEFVRPPRSGVARRRPVARRARKLGWEPRTSFEDLIGDDGRARPAGARRRAVLREATSRSDAPSRMPDLPTITVVTPSFNAAATIEETLRSVREQDYPHVEHVVVDGGSTDGTVDDPRARRGRALRVRARPRALARDEQGRRDGRTARSSAGSTPTTSTSPARCAPSARPSPRAPRPSGRPAAA